MTRNQRPIAGWENAQGFTLIEAVLAMGLLAIGMLGMVTLQFYVVKNNRTGNTFTQATALACAQMERLKNADIEDSSSLLNPDQFPTTTEDADNPLDETEQSGGIYSRSWTVDYYYEDSDGDGIGDTISDSAREVTVTVSFPFVFDGTRTVSLKAITTGSGL